MRRVSRCGAALAVLGALLLAGSLGSPARAQAPVPAKAPAAKPAKLSASAIQILAVESDEVKLPAEFRMALYENLIEEIRKTGKFGRVYRDGERGAGDVADLVTLRSTVRGFKEGSARARQVTTVAGATSIKVHVQLAARDGRALLERDVQGNVHFFGENLRATYNFAKGAAKLIRENF